MPSMPPNKPPDIAKPRSAAKPAMPMPFPNGPTLPMPARAAPAPSGPRPRAEARPATGSRSGRNRGRGALVRGAKPPPIPAKWPPPPKAARFAPPCCCLLIVASRSAPPPCAPGPIGEPRHRGARERAARPSRPARIGPDPPRARIPPLLWRCSPGGDPAAAARAAAAPVQRAADRPLAHRWARREGALHAPRAPMPTPPATPPVPAPSGRGRRPALARPGPRGPLCPGPTPYCAGACAVPIAGKPPGPVGAPPALNAFCPFNIWCLKLRPSRRARRLSFLFFDVFIERVHVVPLGHLTRGSSDRFSRRPGNGAEVSARREGTSVGKGKTRAPNARDGGSAPFRREQRRSRGVTRSGAPFDAVDARRRRRTRHGTRGCGGCNLNDDVDRRPT